jgi:hypothetical protein
VLLGTVFHLWVVHVGRGLDGEGDRVAVVGHLLHFRRNIVVLESLEADEQNTCLQGCQMFSNKNNFEKFWKALELKFLVYIIDLWCILWSFGIFFSVLVYCTTENLAILKICP